MLLKTVASYLKKITNFLVDDRHKNKPYWAMIVTKKPYCVYYFGPFDSYNEAQKMHYGYVEDLIAEKAEGISVEIKRCLPQKLTITEE